MTKTEVYIGMRMFSDGVIRAVYFDNRGEFVLISGTKVRLAGFSRLLR